MLTIEDIEAFCNEHNYDIRISHNGRWIDQKCTPDVLWSVSDFILNYVDNVGSQFTPKDIWESDYARETIAETYSKPGTDELTAANEYDKVFSQPLCLFCYAGIIRDVSTTSRHLYEIEDRDVLEYVARNDLFALRFLQCYIERVLTDSGLIGVFNNFFRIQTRESFNELKRAFIDFYHRYTPIRGEYEPKRIFTKVINPLAFKYSKKGTERGRMSRDIITRADMMYNRDNFRDVYRGKPRNVTRQDWLRMHPDIDVRNGYFEQMMSRSKRVLRDIIIEFRDNISELTQFSERFHDDRVAATQIHHIFPKNDFPEIMHYLENLIALTPNQHFVYAHPNNRTQEIDVAVQKELLIVKTSSIKFNLESPEEEHIYDFDDLLYVLRIGFDDEDILQIERNNYIDVLHAINSHYE